MGSRTWKIFHNSEEGGSNHDNFMVAGPWFHGQWHASTADRIGIVRFGGHDTGREFRADIEAAFFRFYLHNKGQRFDWRASMYQTGTNDWHTYPAWPPPEARPTNLYLHSDKSLSFETPRPDETVHAVEYISDPANPVPYRRRPISPTYPGGDWRTWEAADQRFVDHRPDVLIFASAPLDRDTTVAGALSADLFASTSGTDSDFVVKLVDVFPEDAEKNSWSDAPGPKPGEFAESLNGYELPIAMEVRRGRYNRSYDHPIPLTPNEPAEFVIPLRDHNHAFLKRHRIMVQVQSTWFPVIDRNPQKFVPSIYAASAADFVPATQRVYCSKQLPSHLTLPILETR